MYHIYHQMCYDHQFTRTSFSIILFTSLLTVGNIFNFWVYPPSPHILTHPLWLYRVYRIPDRVQRLPSSGCQGSEQAAVSDDFMRVIDRTTGTYPSSAFSSASSCMSLFRASHTVVSVTALLSLVYWCTYARIRFACYECIRLMKYVQVLILILLNAGCASCT
jgi:hypothetical protein